MHLLGAMSSTNLLKTYQLQGDKLLLLLPKRQFVTYALFALIAATLLYLLLLVDPTTTTPASSPPSSSSTKPSSPAGPWTQEEERSSSSAAAAAACDYSDGEWVPDPRPPLYNGTSCDAIKDGHSCAANGRADTGYLHWRWQPRRCDLPAFSPAAFLRWLRNKHMAFVGDSLARNQAESLVCLLSSASPPELLHSHGGDTRFRRWLFREHNATVSIFWSPFLVDGVEKAEHAGGGGRYNRVFLDAADERWMSELGAIDAAVLSAGHWFRMPSVYHRGGAVVGCHGCAAELNHTETGFLGAFRDAVRRALAEAARRHGGGGGGERERLVAMATLSPSHFEGDWDKGAPCPKKQPYRSGEKELGFTEAEMRKIVVEAVDAANAAAAAASAAAGGGGGGARVRFAALDVTRLANLRPDGHPGPYYMRKNPSAHNDCLHWCMPGPVDTFNQILLQLVLR
ncbi:hypothetical protein ACP4OV_000110 [Aristida adscensionis]